MTKEPIENADVDALAFPWIGLVHVAPGKDRDRESQLPPDERAYSIFIAYGVNKEDALAWVERECDLMNIEVIEYEDVELLEERLGKTTVSEEVLEMRDWMFENKIGANLYRLNTYPRDSE